MKQLLMLGRILYGLPFLVFGVFHLMQAPNMAVIVPDYFPGPGALWVYITGAIFILASLSIMARRYMEYFVSLMAFQLVIFILVVWLPQLSDPELAQFGIVNALKDISLLGAALMLVGVSKRRTKKAAMMTAKENAGQA